MHLSWGSKCVGNHFTASVSVFIQLEWVHFMLPPGICPLIHSWYTIILFGSQRLKCQILSLSVAEKKKQLTKLKIKIFCTTVYFFLALPKEKEIKTNSSIASDIIQLYPLAEIKTAHSVYKIISQNNQCVSSWLIYFTSNGKGKPVWLERRGEEWS